MRVERALAPAFLRLQEMVVCEMNRIGAEMRSKTTSSQTRILVVDDEPVNLHLLVRILSSEGYEVRTASNGEAAIKEAQALPPDLILLDIMMPGMDGFGVCQRLKEDEDTCDIPLIFISVLDQTEDKLKGFSCGGVDYITKPFQHEEVLSRVRTHLTIRRLQRRLEGQNEALEKQVQARTAELTRSNVALQEEIARRKRHEQEKDKLLDLLRHQSDQLRSLTVGLIEQQQDRQETLLKVLAERIERNLTSLNTNLHHTRSALSAGNGGTLTSELVTSNFNDLSFLLTEILNDTRQAIANIRQSSPDEVHLENTPLLHLSTREREVLQLVVDGKSSAEIAEILALAPGTVDTYRSRIMKKLGINDLPSLVKFAIQHKLTSL